MKTAPSILDPSFRYVPAAATSVATTWRRFGWRPTTDDDRSARLRPTAQQLVDWVGALRPLPRIAGRAVRIGR